MQYSPYSFCVPTIAYVINLYLLKSNWLISHKRQYGTIFMDYVKGMLIKIIIKLFMLFVLQDHCYIPYMIKPIYIDAIVYNSNIDLIEQPIGRILPPVPVVFKAAVHP